MPLFFLFGAMSETMKRHERISGEPSRSRNFSAMCMDSEKKSIGALSQKGFIV